MLVKGSESLQLLLLFHIGTRWGAVAAVFSTTCSASSTSAGKSLLSACCDRFLSNALLYSGSLGRDLARVLWGSREAGIDVVYVYMYTHIYVYVDLCMYIHLDLVIGIDRHWPAESCANPIW